jgi:hypothetical protein
MSFRHLTHEGGKGQLSWRQDAPAFSPAHVFSRHSWLNERLQLN